MHIPDADVRYPQADGAGGIRKERFLAGCPRPTPSRPCHTVENRAQAGIQRGALGQLCSTRCPYYGGPELRVGFPQCCVEIQLGFDAFNAFRVRGSEVLGVDIEPFGERSEYFRPADGVTDAVEEVVPPASGRHVP